mmetsp:Transcript_15507/g.22779  ORF Transcript_15507/g.22779 Transcript_15507/m.22779 type:complete len:472 (+) Transcript_15507:204-1619(+)
MRVLRSHRFIILPLAIVSDTPIRIGLNTHAVRHTSSPFAFVGPSVLPMANAMSFVSSVHPASYIVATITKRVSAMPFTLALHKVSFVGGTIGPFESTFPVSLIFAKGTIIDTSVTPAVDTTAMTLIKTILSFIRISISKSCSSVAVPTSMTPVTFIRASIVFINHATKTMRHARTPQNDTTVAPPITVGIQQCLVVHLLPIFTVRARCNCVSDRFPIVNRSYQRLLIQSTNRDFFLQRYSFWVVLRELQVGRDGDTTHVRSSIGRIKILLGWQTCFHHRGTAATIHVAFRHTHHSIRHLGFAIGTAIHSSMCRWLNACDRCTHRITFRWIGIIQRLFVCFGERSLSLGGVQHVASGASDRYIDGQGVGFERILSFFGFAGILCRFNRRLFGMFGHGRCKHNIVFFFLAWIHCWRFAPAFVSHGGSFSGIVAAISFRWVRTIVFRFIRGRLRHACGCYSHGYTTTATTSSFA